MERLLGHFILFQFQLRGQRNFTEYPTLREGILSLPHFLGTARHGICPGLRRVCLHVQVWPQEEGAADGSGTGSWRAAEGDSPFT